ncbi:hypothetical protein ACWIDW_14440 [Microbacterium sp. NPDC055312]
MNKNTISAACAIGLAGLFVLGTAASAGAVEHEASSSDGVATIRIAYGSEFAEHRASVLVLDAEADPNAPRQDDIAFVTEVVADADGTAQLRVQLPRDLDYWLASTVDGGERYVARLDASGGGDGGGDGDGGGGGGDGGGDGGSDGGNHGGGTDVDAGGRGPGSGPDHASESDLATTGVPAWILPGGLLLAAALGAAGLGLRRAGFRVE